jgi:vacuolar-type H+-ATPase subunit E/Vma4
LNEGHLAREVDRIVADANLAEIDKLAEAFGSVTQSFIERSERDLELARAMQDEETAVKEQIKAGVMKSAREMFEFCYLKATGSRRSIWHEQDES